MAASVDSMQSESGMNGRKKKKKHQPQYTRSLPLSVLYFRKRWRGVAAGKTLARSVSPVIPFALWSLALWKKSEKGREKEKKYAGKTQSGAMPAPVS